MIGKIAKQISQSLAKDKKMHDDLLKQAKGDKEMEAKAEQIRKLAEQQKKLLDQITKGAKK